MSYAENQPFPLPFLPNNSSSTTTTPYTGFAILGGSAADVLGVFIAPFKCRIRRACAHITETVAADTTAPIFHFDKAVLGTTPTSDGDVAIITVPDATVAGKMVYDEAAYSSQIELNEGDWVVVKMATDAADSGTVAGKVLPSLLVEYLPEVASNDSDLVETA